MIRCTGWRKNISVSLLTLLLILGGWKIYLGESILNLPTVSRDRDTHIMLSLQLNGMFSERNQALLSGDRERLASLYNKHVRNGRWAYEFEVKRMNYLHHWIKKQGVEFEDIDSLVVIRRIKPKGEDFSISLLVSTEYRYRYNDQQELVNSFRIGTYHALDITPGEEGWVIIKEWYRDPFADPSSLDDTHQQFIQEIILSNETRDLSNLDEKRLQAIAYADRYVGAANPPQHDFGYNPNYKNYNYQGGNCANFMSQILYEAGEFRKNPTWNYEKGAGTRAWVNAHTFNNYMLSSGRATTIAYGTYEQVLEESYRLLPGDYIAYEKRGKVTHISVVTGADSKGYTLVNSHNADRYRVPWDIGWNDGEMKFRLVRVHY